jgi:integrase
MGYCGACRREELTIMSVNDVDFKSVSILVSIPKTKTNKPRLFAITDSESIDLIKTYHNL